MAAFDLPSRTIVNKVIPKNAFDSFTTSKQKKRFTDLLERIRWVNKLSAETINLTGKDIKEIQVFEIELKVQEDISDLIDIINKAIPYPIIFYISFQDKAYLCASKKHPHPVNENVSVVDWTFASKWKTKSKINYELNLKQNLDFIYHDFCLQLSSKYFKTNSIEDLVALEQKRTELNRKILNTKASISRSKQYNKKVELNIELQKLEVDLKKLLDDNHH
ncbi:MAG: DUF4391 domain-containing protein [Verrucomicrobia bacterium]|nr:DUF4391 domain-containing protein [Verrucomicrobiota bacterium]